MEKAKNLKDVYNLFDPMVPLRGEYLKAFYVDIRPTLFYGLKNSIQISESPDKILLSGYKGCGKSTELNRLCEDKDIKERFIPIKFSIKDKLDLFDFDYKDLLVVVSAEIYNVLKANGIQMDQDILEEIRRWASKIEIINMKTTTAGVDAGTLLDFIFGKIGGWMKVEDSTRTEIRTSISQNVSNLIDIINRMLTYIKERKNVKPVLLVIEDLDKLPIESATKLFFSNILPFLQLNCKIVFTFPFALMVSTEWGIISKTFRKPIILPNITIHDKTGKVNDDAYRIMKEIFYKRSIESLITERAINNCIRYSGGVVFDFIRIISESANVAMVKGKEKIEEDDVEKVVISMRDDYAFLTEEHISKLNEIYKKKVARGEEENNLIRDLIASLSIIKYYNSEEWFDIHPLTEHLVNR